MVRGNVLEWLCRREWWRVLEIGPYPSPLNETTQKPTRRYTLFINFHLLTRGSRLSRPRGSNMSIPIPSTTPSIPSSCSMLMEVLSVRPGLSSSSADSTPGSVFTVSNPSRISFNCAQSFKSTSGYNFPTMPCNARNSSSDT